MNCCVRLLYTFFLVISLTQLSYGQSIASKKFTNSAEETRYYKLISEIRCPVCQGQNIAESNAGLAKDLRIQVKTMIMQGSHDDDIYAFMVERYGDFIIFKPPMNSKTYLLWYAPFIFLLLAIFFLVKFILNRSKTESNS